MQRSNDLPEKFSDKIRDSLKWGMAAAVVTILVMLAGMIWEGRNRVYSPLEAICTPILCAVPPFLLITINTLVRSLWGEFWYRIAREKLSPTDRKFRIE